MNNNDIPCLELTQEYTKKEHNYFSADRPDMLRFIPSNALVVLEIGCGEGNFGQLLKNERSAEVWGVELDQRAASLAASKLDKVICAAFNNSLGLPDKSFDCIVFNDVLEHLVDPWSALCYANQLLRDGGSVVASIPNVRYICHIWDLLRNKNWEYTSGGILDKTHLRFFTKLSILSTFKSLGYSVKTIEGIHPFGEGNPHQAIKFKILNWILFRQIEDMRYLQFVIVAYTSEGKVSELINGL